VPSIEFKTCTKCGQEKWLAEFYRRSRQETSVRPVCKACHNARTVLNQKRDPDHVRKERAWRLRREYGISPERYEEMLIDQRGRCAVCGLSFVADRRETRPYVDHCHSSGAVRGLLCLACNTGLGQFEDDPGRLKAAIEYLENS
jgi:ribosomal protein S27AE